MTEIEKIKEELKATKIELETLKAIHSIEEIYNEKGKVYYCKLEHDTSIESMKKFSRSLKEIFGDRFECEIIVGIIDITDITDNE